MAISRSLAKQIAELILGNKSYTPPTTWYFGLSSLPIDNGMIPAGSEPPDGIGYSRTAIPNTQLSGATGSFTEAAYDSTRPLAFVTNAQEIKMSEITGGSEPSIMHFFLSTQSANSNTSGNRNVEMSGSFDRSRILQVNSTLVIDAGGAVFEILNV